MNRRQCSALRRVLVTGLVAGLLFGAAAAQQGPYRFSLPAGWARSVDGSVETLIPGGEPAGTAQALLMAPKASSGDFEAQFDRERAALESHWGLMRPHATAPQRGHTAAGPYAAHFASYASEDGPRYMAFLAIGRQSQFVMLVFVASSDDTFNRLAPQVTQLWQGLQVGP